MRIKTRSPAKLPLRSLEWVSFVDLLGPAHETIGRFEEIISSVPRPETIFSILTLKESLISNRAQKVPIELKDVLGCENEHARLIQHINDYHAALRSSKYIVDKGALSLAALRKIHGIIKQHTSKSKKDVGRFRTKRGWIGVEGCKIDEAYFYPPNVTAMRRSLKNLQTYFQSKEKDPLVQLAIIVAQFLEIHPFIDGNGRVARALIPLFLYKKGLISQPIFSLSGYFMKNRINYIENLFKYSERKNWEGWVKYFLKGISEQGKKNCDHARAIRALYFSTKKQLNDETLEPVLIYLFKNPAFTKEDFLKNSGVSRPKAIKTLNSLVKKAIVKPQTKEQMLAFEDLINTVKD